MNNLLPSKQNTSSSKGFTLIELMVVISIIAFLAIIGIAAYVNAQKVARDGRRRADIEAVASALESKHDGVAGTYLPTAGLAIDSGSTTTAIDTFFASGTAPKDPSSVTPYFYTITMAATPGNTSFTACADLEAGNGGNSSDKNGTASAGGSFFCIKSRQ